MMTVSKFEFFLINENIELARIKEDNHLQKLTGLDWQKLAVLIEKKYPFSNFKFEDSGFSVFKVTAPQYLVKSPETGKPKWDSDECIIDSWGKLLNRSFSQFRNNIAHGNKGQLLAPFTNARTEEFMAGGYALIGFVADQIFEQENWEMEIAFQ